MIKNCDNCGRSWINNPNKINYCVAPHVEKTLPCISSKGLHYWVKVRHIYKGNATGKIFELLDNGDKVVLHRGGDLYRVGDKLPSNTTLFNFTKLNYSEYEQYICSNEPFINGSEQEDNPMKYKSTGKDITLKSLIKDGACDSAINWILDNYEFKVAETIAWSFYRENAVEREVQGGIDFLLGNGYIEKVKPEIKYNPEKVYTYKYTPLDTVYKLHQTPDGLHYSFVNLNNSYGKNYDSVSTSAEETIKIIQNLDREVVETDTIVEALKIHGVI